MTRHAKVVFYHLGKLTMAIKLFHYTYGHRLSSIQRDGMLRATGITIPANERPSLWYSTRSDFEPTALKPVKFPGHDGPVRLSMEQLHELAGVYRFATDTELVRAKPFPQACRDIGIMPTDARQMISVGIELGADPADWYATTRHQLVNLHVFERWDGEEWVAANMATEVEMRAQMSITSEATGQRWTDMQQKSFQ